MEIWRDIKDYPNYQVSNMGRVKSLKYGKEKILKSCNNNKGYIQVVLYKDGKQKHYLIHRLVAQAFLPNPDNLPEVNHKNENPTDNRIENLEWCTSQYNNNFGTHNERMAKTLSIPILQFSKTGEFIKKWDSATEVERDLGFNQGSISRCLKGKKYKSVGGYKWHYHYKSLWLKNHISLKDKKVA